MRDGTVNSIAIVRSIQLPQITKALFRTRNGVLRVGPYNAAYRCVLSVTFFHLSESGNAPRGHRQQPRRRTKIIYRIYSLLRSAAIQECILYIDMGWIYI